ncbi:hypothetical protein D3C81_969970 [compost metagenome]
MNRMEIGKRVFSIHHADGKAKPEHYWIEFEGTIKRIENNNQLKLVDWGKQIIFSHSEDRFLKPNHDKFCYFMTEFENIEQYKDGELYKVPYKILIDHMKSYQSPWS